ncbi:M23 family metallopeptidase [Chitinispirillales bacterium ANBcel5]|uniref:M23 family metallopeptidase n=1 Tax=Cellulosispirillum alkaliphilum TaxID=3039283 RepID=UPI002A503247|nr:M23 family metallopeptidase [Chitinispirillales bacterium ANBcel5]
MVGKVKDVLDLNYQRAVYANTEYSKKLNWDELLPKIKPDWYAMWIAGSKDRFAEEVAFYQLKNGLKPISGVIGPITWKAMGGVVFEPLEGVEDLFPLKKLQRERPRFFPPLPLSHRITSPFGMRIHPVSGVRRFHNGIDLEADIGDPVVAFADGIVEHSLFSETGGHMIVLKHANEYKTRYLHLDKRLVKSGEVIAGQKIGTAGNTGISSGPHLHFEIIRKGKRVDPTDYINYRLRQ